MPPELVYLRKPAEYADSVFPVVALKQTTLPVAVAVKLLASTAFNEPVTPSVAFVDMQSPQPAVVWFAPATVDMLILGTYPIV